MIEVFVNIKIMGQRRMFTKEITNTSEFLMMSQSAQALYFHIGMNADDDGFCEIFTVMRMTESKPDDLQILHAKGFIYVVDDKVCIVKGWHENNQIRADRYKRSKHLEDKNMREIYVMLMEDKIKKLSVYKNIATKKQVGKPLVAKMETQVSIGKVNVGKDSIVKYTKKDIELTNLLHNSVNQNYSHIKKKTEKQLEKDYEEMNRLHRIDKWTYEQIKYVIKWSQNDAFWKQNIRSVKKLRIKFEELVVRIKSQGEKNQVVKI